MIWFLYNVLFTVGYVALLPRFLWRMWRRGGYRKGFLQRFGFYSDVLKKRLAAQKRIWIHAVSVGEIYVALRFMEEMRSRDPNASFLLTTTTSTGHQVARDALYVSDILLYFPVDFPWVVRRAVGWMNPSLLLLTENELWPNLLRAVKKKGIPVALVNGRISVSSYRGYRKVRWMTRRALPLVDLFLVQSEVDRTRVVSLGAMPDKVRVVGSAKYDILKDDPEARTKANAILRSAGMDVSDLVLMGGSTWPGEERILLEIYKNLKPSFPALKLVLVPRHMERRAAVRGDIVRAGLHHVCRSAALSAADGPPRAEVLLVDTTGELKTLYAGATVIFVGKSLTQLGGQNIIEPALMGKPIVVGPHLENFPEIAEEFRAADAMLQVPDADQLAVAIHSLLADKPRRIAYGQRARELVKNKRGAIERSLRYLHPLREPAATPIPPGGAFPTTDP